MYLNWVVIMNTWNLSTTCWLVANASQPENWLIERLLFLLRDNVDGEMVNYIESQHILQLNKQKLLQGNPLLSFTTPCHMKQNPQYI